MKRSLASIGLLIAVAALSIGVGYMYGSRNAATQAKSGLADSQTVSADTLKAGGLAYQAFLASLEAQDSPDKDFSAFIRSTSNYSARVSVDADSYTFTFMPNRYHGGVVKGAAVYKVDRRDYHVEGGAQK